MRQQVLIILWNWAQKSTARRTWGKKTVKKYCITVEKSCENTLKCSGQGSHILLAGPISQMSFSHLRFFLSFWHGVWADHVSLRTMRPSLETAEGEKKTFVIVLPTVIRHTNEIMKPWNLAPSWTSTLADNWNLQQLVINVCPDHLTILKHNLSCLRDALRYHSRHYLGYHPRPSFRTAWGSKSTTTLLSLFSSQMNSLIVTCVTIATQH